MHDRTRPKTLEINGYDGSRRPPSPLSDQWRRWSLRQAPPAIRAFLRAPPRADPRDWHDQRVGWGLVLPYNPALSAQEQATAIDAPEPIRELVEQRGKPGQPAPKRSAPWRCRAARRRPNSSAACFVASPGWTHSRASMAGRATITSGTGGPSGVLSHSRPAASVVKKPSGGAPRPSGQVLANTSAPSSRVSRLAPQMLPPGTGVSRIRWWVRNVGRCCGCARR